MKHVTYSSALGSVKGKNDGRKCVFTARSEQRLHGVIERAFQIAEGDVGIDRQAFDLMKHGRVAGVGRIVAMHRPGNHDANRRTHLLHRANLHRRGMRAQQQALALRLRLLSRDEERVLRVARGMVRREIQRLEIVVVGFDHRAFGDRVAQFLEYADDLVHRFDDGVFCANGTADAGEGDVHGGRRVSESGSLADVRGLDELR